MSYYFPKIFATFPHVKAVQTSRQNGHSKAPYQSFNLGKNTDDDLADLSKNVEKLSSDLQIPSDNLVRCHQVHGTEILAAQKGGTYSGYDAIISSTPNLFLSITTADCIPILIYDSKNQVVAAAHAGWRGLKEEILYKTIQKMKMEHGTQVQDCFLYAGPCISVEYFEVGEEVAIVFDSKYHSLNEVTQKIHLDLKNILKDQIQLLGIPSNQVEIDARCSYKEEQLYYSHRRDKGKTGRMLTGIGFFKE